MSARKACVMMRCEVVLPLKRGGMRWGSASLGTLCRSGFLDGLPDAVRRRRHVHALAAVVVIPSLIFTWRVRVAASAFSGYR